MGIQIKELAVAPAIPYARPHVTLLPILLPSSPMTPKLSPISFHAIISICNIL